MTPGGRFLALTNPNAQNVVRDTGAIAAAKAALETYVRSLAWDAGESVLFGLFGLANGDAQLGTVNTSTGVVSLRGNPLTGGTVSSAGAALDAAGDRYFFAGQPSGGNRAIYTISTINGIESASPDITGSALDILALRFDPGPLFADGFASGNATAWSAVVP
jgi:hypothetical protein